MSAYICSDPISSIVCGTQQIIFFLLIQVKLYLLNLSPVFLPSQPRYYFFMYLLDILIYLFPRYSCVRSECRVEDQSPEEP